jgi:hypothetical protein
MSFPEARISQPTRNMENPVYPPSRKQVIGVNLNQTFIPGIGFEFRGLVDICEKDAQVASTASLVGL